MQTEIAHKAGTKKTDTPSVPDLIRDNNLWDTQPKPISTETNSPRPGDPNYNDYDGPPPVSNPQSTYS